MKTLSTVFLLHCACLFTAIPLTGQELQPQFRFRAGESLVWDKFAKRNPNNTKSGYAQDGYVFGIGLQQPLTKYIDATIDINVSNYQFYEEVFLESYQISFPSYAWQIEDGSYQSRNVLLGARFYLGNQFKFFVNPAVGFSWLSFPSLQVNGSQIVKRELETVYLRQNIDNTRTFMVSFSTGIEYFISESFGLNLQYERVNYSYESGSRIDVKDLDQSEGSFRLNAKGEYSVRNITLGLIFKFKWQE
ncbi:MAG: hypothetical protein RIC95_06830 [Vicingaceae bacterium]